VARLLGGEAHGRRVLCPGPGHSRTDRSLSVKLGDDAPEGFVVHSFAGDDPLACKDYVRERLNLPARDWRKRIPRDLPKRAAPILVPDADDDEERNRLEYPHSLFRAAKALKGTLGETYLNNFRGIRLEESLDHVLRFHPALVYERRKVPGIVALFRDVVTDAPRGVHRIFLDADGRKLDRRMLGPTARAAIKIDANEDVVSGLHIGEGIETCLAARSLGYRPVWAAGSADAIAAFPVLAGIEAINVFTENDPRSEAAACAVSARYAAAGCEAWIYQPPRGDFNDSIRGIA
jgi:hypothetical protein